MECRGYTQYSEPESWLSVTYPTIYAIWRQVISSNTNSTTLNMELTCAICKVKPSSGQHYGVKMCEADKQFLKRSFHQQLQYPPCSNAGSGLVCPPRPRGWCQICRLQTCLTNPVNITMIRVGEKVKKSKKETKARDPTAYTTNTMSFLQNQQLQASCNNSSPDIGGVTTMYNSPSATYQYLQYPTPSFSQPYISPSTFDIEAEKLLVEPIDNSPLDLRIKKVHVDDDDDWFLQEVAFTDLHSQQPMSDHLDVSKFPSLDISNSFTLWSSRQDISITGLSKPDLSRSIANISTHKSPSPVLESSYGVNKLSVNSTILGHALTQIQASISMSSSLANLSSVSDILTEEADK